VEEILFLSQELDQDPAMEEVLRGKERVVILSPVSDSPRKTMPPRSWQPIVDRLVEAGAFIIQVGKKNETHITHAYSLLGITTPRQLAFLIRRSSLVLCVDNFIMHLAHLAHLPAIVVWGPTRHEVYGYPEHVHFPTGSDCPEYSRCLGPQYAGNYATACPLGEEKHCTNTVNGDALSMEAMRLLAVVR
jgi:ADP-heptose:LPS heptosyltransferase